MKYAFGILKWILRFNQIMFSFGALLVISLTLLTTIFGMKLSGIVSFFYSAHPSFFLIPPIASVVLVLHVWIFTLGLQIICEIRAGQLGTLYGLRLLHRLRNAFFFVFFPSFFMQLLSGPFNTFLSDIVSEHGVAKDAAQALPMNTVFINFLSGSQYFFIWFDGLNAIVAGLLVGAVEHYLRESQNMKSELEQVI